jgi:hypothetical protein
MGLMMRETVTDKAAHVSLIIYPGKTEKVEAPNWHVRLLTRAVAGEQATANIIGPSLTEPVVTWGRLTGNVWLRLQRKGNNFTGFTSTDGKTWTTIGTAMVQLKKNLLVGLPVSSGIKTVSTTIMFDSVSVRKF